jgi:prevent-host-death family protein
MPKLTFCNSQGELIDIPSIAATGAKSEFGAILERAALGGAVVIRRHNAPKAVLAAYSDVESLSTARLELGQAQY